MIRIVLIAAAALAAASASASETAFKFSELAEGAVPAGFDSAVVGEGRPGTWQIVKDKVESAFEPLFGTEKDTNTISVLAQQAEAPIDEHFPVFIHNEELTDFIFSTRFKIRSGVVDQMAGVAFRIQDTRNFYVIRASAHDNTLRFYKVVDGLRGQLIGPKINIEKHVWYDLRIRCTGNKIECWFDGKEAFPALTDHSFVSGRIGFWTKSDTIAYFGDSTLTFKARLNLAQSLIEATLREFPYVLAMQMIGEVPVTEKFEVIATHDGEGVGTPATDSQIRVCTEGVRLHDKSDLGVILTVPLSDRNGDVIGAARITMESFPGQTKSNAMARTVPLVRFMESRIGVAKTLLDD